MVNRHLGETYLDEDQVADMDPAVLREVFAAAIVDPTVLRKRIVQLRKSQASDRRNAVDVEAEVREWQEDYRALIEELEEKGAEKMKLDFQETFGA